MAGTMEKGSPSAKESILALLENNDYVPDCTDDEEFIQNNTSLCSKLLFSFEEIMQNSSSSVEEVNDLSPKNGTRRRRYQRKSLVDSNHEQDRFIHTSIQDYNNKNTKKESMAVPIRQVIGSSISSMDLTSLITVLVSFFNHRIQDSLPNTQDDVDDTELLDNNATTLSELSILSARVYVELIGMHGAFGMGLIDIGALSGLAALVKRWGVECCGRVRVMPTTRRADKKKRKFSFEDDSLDDDEDDDDGLNGDVVIEGGFKLALSLAKALESTEFYLYSSDAREALIESSISVMSSMAALTTADMEKYEIKNGQQVVDSFHKSIEDCVMLKQKNNDLISQEADGLQQNKKDSNFQRETLIFVLRSLFPFMTHRVDLPYGVKGKNAAFKAAAALIHSMMQRVSHLFPTDAMSRYTPRRLSVKNSSRTPLSERSFSVSTRKTPRSLKGHRNSDDFPILTPSLKKSATPKRSCRRFNSASRSIIQDVLTNFNNQSQSILDIYVGMMQKISTIKGLERAEVRLRMISFLKDCLLLIPNYARSSFIQFTTQMCLSKISSHRLFGVEVFGEILLMEFTWDLNEEDKENFHSHTKVTSSNPRSSFQHMSINSSDCSVSILILDALYGRISDRAPAIRARAAHSLSKVLKCINSGEHFTSPRAERYLRKCINKLKTKLIVSLRERATCDTKATVRKASITAFVQLFLMDDLNENEEDTTRLEHLDVSMLCQLCNDSSVAVRKEAAESLVTLLQKQYHCCEYFANSSILETAFADNVLPLVLDVEATCAEKIVELFALVVIEPLLEAADEKKGHSLIRKEAKYYSSWRVLARLGGIPSSAGSKSGRRILRIALQKIAEKVSFTESYKSVLLLNEICYVLKFGLSQSEDHTLSLEAYSSLGDDVLQQVGAWCLLESLTDLFSPHSRPSSSISPRIDLKKHISMSSLDVGFICSSCEVFSKLSSQKNSSVGSESVIVTIARSCLYSLSRLVPFLETTTAVELSSSLKKQLTSFTLCPNLIGASTSVLLATTKFSSSDSSHENFIAACSEWIEHIFKECENSLDTFISTYPVDYDDVICSKIDRVLFTVGELCLIGFNTNENHDHTSKKIGSCVSMLGQEREGDSNLGGIYVEPPDHLVYLVQALLPPTLPSNSKEGQNTVKPTSGLIRAHAFTALGKICLRNEALAKSCINFFARELRRNSDCNSAAQSNALLILGDLCVRYPNLVDRFLPLMSSCLQSQKYDESELDSFENPSVITDFRSSVVKQHAVLILSNLLIQDFIKWKGDLFHRFLVASVDQDPLVANLTKLVLSGPLLTKQPSLFFNNFVNTLFVLNGCSTHMDVVNISTGKFESKYLKLPRIESREKRVEMYSMLLDKMKDEEKIGITARLVRDVLGETLKTSGVGNSFLSEKSRKVSSTSRQSIDGLSSLCRDGDIYHVMADCLAILMNPSLSIGKFPKKGENDDEDENSSMTTNGPTASQLSLVRGKLLSKISRKQMVESVIPTLSNLKICLEKNRSPLLKDLMRVMVRIFRQFKNEVSEILATNKTLLQELEYENKRCSSEDKLNCTLKKNDEMGISSAENCEDHEAV